MYRYTKACEASYIYTALQNVFLSTRYSRARLKTGCFAEINGGLKPKSSTLREYPLECFAFPSILFLVLKRSSSVWLHADSRYLCMIRVGIYNTGCTGMEARRDWRTDSRAYSLIVFWICLWDVREGLKYVCLCTIVSARTFWNLFGAQF